MTNQAYIRAAETFKGQEGYIRDEEEKNDTEDVSSVSIDRLMGQVSAKIKAFDIQIAAAEKRVADLKAEKKRFVSDLSNTAANHVDTRAGV